MSSEDTDSEAGPTGRQDDGSVVVPLRLYKSITVFSTLVATAIVVFGFFMFDAASRLDNPIRETVLWVVAQVGIRPSVGTVNVAFGLLGVALIILGAWSYVLGTRFKTAEMIEGANTE